MGVCSSRSSDIASSRPVKITLDPIQKQPGVVPIDSKQLAVHDARLAMNASLPNSPLIISSSGNIVFDPVSNRPSLLLPIDNQCWSIALTIADTFLLECPTAVTTSNSVSSPCIGAIKFSGETSEFSSFPLSSSLSYSLVSGPLVVDCDGDQRRIQRAVLTVMRELTTEVVFTLTGSIMWRVDHTARGWREDSAAATTIDDAVQFTLSTQTPDATDGATSPRTVSAVHSGAPIATANSLANSNQVVFVLPPTDE